jgi:hypothetical protein
VWPARPHPPCPGCMRSLALPKCCVTTFLRTQMRIVWGIVRGSGGRGPRRRPCFLFCCAEGSLVADLTKEHDYRRGNTRGQSVPRGKPPTGTAAPVHPRPPLPADPGRRGLPSDTRRRTPRGGSREEPVGACRQFLVRLSTVPGGVLETIKYSTVGPDPILHTTSRRS